MIDVEEARVVERRLELERQKGGNVRRGVSKLLQTVALRQEPSVISALSM